MRYERTQDTHQSSIAVISHCIAWPTSTQRSVRPPPHTPTTHKDKGRITTLHGDGAPVLVVVIPTLQRELVLLGGFLLGHAGHAAAAHVSALASVAGSRNRTATLMGCIEELNSEIHTLYTCQRII